MSQHRGQGLLVLSLLPIVCRLGCLTFFMCSDESGDRPRPLPEIDELNGAIDIYERKGTPSWDYDVSAVLVLYSYCLIVQLVFFFFCCVFNLVLYTWNDLTQFF